MATGGNEGTGSSSYGGGGSSYGGGGTGYGGGSTGYGGGSSYGKSSYGYGSLGSDTSSARSYGSQRSYGGGGAHSSYGAGTKSYDYGPSSRSTSGAYSGSSAYGGSSYSRRPSSVDRSLSLISKSGAVSSLKDRFDRSTSVGPSERSYGYGSTPKRESSYSRDYGTGATRTGYGSDSGSSRSYGSSSYGRTNSTSGRGYGYSSALDKPEPRSSSYGSYSTPTAREKSADRPSYGYSTSSARDRTESRPRSGLSYTTASARKSSERPSRTSRADSYGRSPSREYGTSYGGRDYGSPAGTTEKSRAKSSALSLTPFSSRRTTSSKEPTLTPFTTRRQQREREEAAQREKEMREREKRRERDKEKERERNERPKPRKSTIPEDELSSDSDAEPKGGNRDPRVRYLTSRACSPLDPERDGWVDMRTAKGKKSRKRLISRAKTKKYPVPKVRRRRVLREQDVQVDIDDLNRYCGRVTTRPKRAAGEDKPEKSRSRPGSSSSRKDSSRHSSVSEPPPDSPGSSWRHKQSKDPSLVSAKKIEKVSLPKQSAFVPKSYGRNRTESETTDAEAPAPRRTSAKKEPAYQGDAIECKQSSFINKRKQREDKETKERYAKAMAQKPKQVADLTPENLSLKDSIDKVRDWKKQLYEPEDDWRPPIKWGRPPLKQQSEESVSSDESTDHGAIDGEPIAVYGKDDATGRKGSASRRRQDPLSPSGSDRSDRTLRECEASSSRQKPQKMTSREQKMFAGVPSFPKEGDVEVKPGKKRSQIGRKGDQDRSPSPYDNLRDKDRAPSPYDNKPPRPRVIIDKCDSDKGRTIGSRLAPGPSIDSLTSGYIDESDVIQSDEEIGLSRTESMASLNSMDTQMGSLQRRKNHLRAPSVESIGTSISSLPDVVTSSEQARRGGGFIGKVQNIDSYLGFTETEDDMSDFSDEDSETDYRQRGSLQRQGRERDTNLGPITEENGLRNGYGPMVDNVYIAEWTDVDDLMDEDELDQYSRFVPKPPDRLKSQSSLDIPPSKIDHGSSDSLLDTPVPDTPDEPLAPMQAFPFATPRSKKIGQSASVDGLNDMDSVSNKLQNQTLKPKKQRTKKTQSVGNLDDLDNLLDTIASSTPKTKRRKKGEEISAFDLLTRDAKDDLRTQVSIEEDNEDELGDDNVFSPSTDEPLISIDVVDDAGAGGTPTGTLINLDISPQHSPPRADKKYPPGHSDAAVKTILALKDEQGEVSITDLCNVCAKQRTPKPPWVEEEEDRNFKGYTNATEMIEDLGIDCKKVGTIKRVWK